MRYSLIRKVIRQLAYFLSETEQNKYVSSFLKKRFVIYDETVSVQ